jgi:predicted nucleic acid-binding Zn ribbon protein
VCHNCHSEIHADVRALPDKFVVFDESYASWKKIEDCDSCPVCKIDKPVKQKYCSHKCAQTNRRKVDWDSINLLELMEQHSIGELEEMLGVSNAAIYKRRKKILNEIAN